MMKVVALISGGKDSCFNIMQCIAEGHEIVALANLYPSENLECEELDSYMYQSVGSKGIDFYAQSMHLPLYRQEITGKSIAVEKHYSPTVSDEVEDLFSLICKVKLKHPDLQAVSSGAILSDYQRNRVENICDRLNLVSLAFLWQRNQAELLAEMIDCELDAIIIKIASYGLTKRHLQRHLGDLQTELLNLSNQFELNVCGEGGEYETFTLDTPLFTHKINIVESGVVELAEENTLSPVAYLAIKRAELIEKDWSTIKRTASEVSTLPMLTKQKSLIHLYSNVTQELRQSVQQKIPDPIQSEQWEEFKFEVIGPVVATIDWSLGDSAIYQTALKSLLNLKERIDSNSSFKRVVYSLVCVRDMAWFAELNRAYSEIFPTFQPPPRACIGVPKCILYENGVEVSPDLSFSCLLHEKETGELSHLHVKSLSHWAPANIGPYSQAVQLRLISQSRLFVSGQIGMLPEDLSLADSIEEQVCLSLRHAERVAKATCNFNLIKNLDFGICYAISKECLETSKIIFHDILCNIVESSDFTSRCSCDRIIWVCVDQLPKSAQVEWQIIFKSEEVHPAILAKQKLLDNLKQASYIISKSHLPCTDFSNSLFIPVNFFLSDLQVAYYVYLR